MGEPQLGGPLHKHRYVVPDGTVVEQRVLLRHHVLNDGTLFVGKTRCQAVNDCHEGPSLGFFGHPKSFSVTEATVNSGPWTA
jgi:hypothetical protein